MAEDPVRASKRSEVYGWARLSHEATVIENCAKLGGVFLNPSVPQPYLSTPPTVNFNSRTTGFGR